MESYSSDDTSADAAGPSGGHEDLGSVRRRTEDQSTRVEALEERLLETRGQLQQAVSQNEKLTYTLQQAKEQLALLREEVEKLTQPPAAYGTFLGINPDGSVDVFASGRKMRVALHPNLDPAQLLRGDEVVLNESLNVIEARDPDRSGEVVTLKEVLDDGRRALIYGRGDEERVAEIADSLRDVKMRAGDAILMDLRSGLLVEKLPRQQVEELVLEEVPDVSYDDVGGLDRQIEDITDAVELPYLHRELFHDYALPAPKGILLYGPPGCGKTLIAKAVANSLAKKVAALTGNVNVRSYFLNIKGPELLNKYVGETERQIRLVFERAREKADEGVPVIVFFDEMDSLFRTRGTGISSDMESTIVPQLLAEIDGVETLRDVIVIGATNREDLIDPAILRPGRLDVKIKIERPDEGAATQIFSRYLTSAVPLDADTVRELGGGDPDKACQAMIEQTVAEMYRDDDVQPVLGGHVPERRQGAPVLQGLRLRRDDREHRSARQEGGGQARDRRAGPRDPRRGPHRLDPTGVQGERGPAEHDEPGRLGAHLGQEGRAHRLRPHADRPGRRRPGRRSVDRARRHGPVPLGDRWASPRSSASRPSTPSRRRGRTPTPSARRARS